MLRYASGRDAGSGDGDVSLTGRVLVVDDDALMRATHRSILAKRFDVVTAASGAEALEICAVQMPDLIVLDVEMPGLDGYETCRRVRQSSCIPIIFATSHQSLDEQMKAYDVGGNDLITKPVNSEILLRKVAVAIRQYRTATALADEKKALEKMAMGFLSTASQGGTLLNFMRGGIVCRDYRSLAERLLQATGELGLMCSVRINHDGGPTVVTSHGEPVPLELAIFDHAREMGRLFQFKRRLVVNYDRVSIFVANMPDETTETERAGILRDSLAILAESVEALAINVDTRQEGQHRAEQMQVALSRAESTLNAMGEKQRAMLLDSRLLLQELIDNIEKSYSWLNTTQAQETAISATMADSVQRVLDLLGKGGDFDEQFAQVMQALHAGRSQGGIELF